jgi:chromosome segregation ATPase
VSCTLDDLRTAAGGSDLGVNLIPFPDLRNDATSMSDEVKRRKSEAEIDTNTLRNQKESNLWDIKQLKEKIEKEKQETFPREDDIKEWQEEIDEDNAKIEGINEKLARGLVALERLSEAREKLREYFDQAKSQLSDLRSNPERALGSDPSDEDKEKFEEYIRVIVGEIEDEEEGHKNAEDELQKSLETTRKILAKTE